MTVPLEIVFRASVILLEVRRPDQLSEVQHLLLGASSREVPIHIVLGLFAHQFGIPICHHAEVSRSCVRDCHDGAHHSVEEVFSVVQRIGHKREIHIQASRDEGFRNGALLHHVGFTLVDCAHGGNRDEEILVLLVKLRQHGVPGHHLRAALTVPHVRQLFKTTFLEDEFVKRGLVKDTKLLEREVPILGQ